ncbi:MAG: DDE-type integrase/transposase/recombinase [Candidatus Bathyarchaeota archaeon]|nr:DDE-type integrase/transposase/recombinase [Candidatus Bathyarchaeota archaeon]
MVAELTRVIESNPTRNVVSQKANKVNGRKGRGFEIAKNEVNQVQRIGDYDYEVLSQSGNGRYLVTRVYNQWVCTCPDYKFRKVKCKHIWAVEFSLTLREEVKKETVIQQIVISECVFCHSQNLKKNGVRRNKHGAIQRFFCHNCGKTFTVNIGFERMKHNPQAITSAMQLYFSGESLRNTQKSLRLLGVDVSHQTVYNWIRKYVRLMERYIENLKPQVSDTWRADELWLKIKGDMKYVFAIMDDETRFWIAQEVAESKYKHDARKLLQLAKKVTGTKPMIFITDGLPAYHDAFKKEFWTLRGPRTQHIRHIKVQGDMNNNKMERLNGEIRDREKVMRGLKKDDTPILKGYQIFHNYIREHEGLDGKTPAEVCGITVEGKNKWKTLIQNASISK